MVRMGGLEPPRPFGHRLVKGLRTALWQADASTDFTTSAPSLQDKRYLGIRQWPILKMRVA